MEVINFEGNDRYNSFQIIAKYKDLFKSCQKSKRKIIKRMKLKTSEYIYGYFSKKKNKWVEGDVDHSGSKVLILKSVVHAYINKYGNAIDKKKINKNDDENDVDTSDDDTDDDTNDESEIEESNNKKKNITNGKKKTSKDDNNSGDDDSDDDNNKNNKKKYCQ